MIKFRQYYVTSGELKARVSYHLDGRIDGRKCVTIYQKDCGMKGRSFKNIFGDLYINETDLMTDYFDTGHVNLFEDNPYYIHARKAAEQLKEARNKRYQKYGVY